MSLEAARGLPIPDLLRALEEKLGFECTRLQKEPIPLASSVRSLESEIDSLEARAQDLLRCISSLRTFLQPVNRLLPEILSHIARYLVKDDDDDARSIVPLTHVCRYWRGSIISAPENWTLISNRNHEMTAVSLQRAKAAPLEITIHMHLEAESSPLTDIITPYLQNTRTLAVYNLPTMEELTDMLPNFPGSMPALRSLTLDSEDFEWDSSIDPFESFIPPLNRLSLINIPLYPPLLNLTTLVEFTFHGFDQFDFSSDTLLDFLEQNQLLESLNLCVGFAQFPLRYPQRQAVTGNRLRHLSIECANVVDTRTLVSYIPLQRGANLEIRVESQHAKLNDIFPHISAIHLSNLHSPTFFKLENQGFNTKISLRGASGALTFDKHRHPEDSFADFVGLPLANAREVHLLYRRETPIVFCPSYFPALETLAIEGSINSLSALSVLLQNPSSSPSLKTFAFLNCDLTGEFMEQLTNFASERQTSPTSTWLYRILIIHRDGKFPSAASVRELEDYVKVVDFRMGDRFPAHLV